MRSQARHQRKHRHNKGYDDEQLVPHDDPQSYSRHLNSQHSDNYKTHHSSGRSSYDMNRNSSSSRSHHDPHSWHEAQDNYPYQDSYHRGGRDDYETRERDDGWNTRRSKETNSLPLQREEWPSRYDNGYSQSYQEPVPWNSTHYDDSHASYARWPSDDLPAPIDDHRTLQQPLRERDVDTRWDRGHQRDQRRDRGTGSNAVEVDAGWQPRYRESTSIWDERTPRDPPPLDPPPRDPPPQQRAPSPPIDRSWEPAASWKSSHRDEPHTQHSQNGHRNHNHHSNVRQNGKKNNHSHHNKGRRDWRNDDGNLNNWNKREGYTQEKSSKSNRRKHQRSRSRSRSRSPAEESHYSRYSSLGRSRSRSISPAPKRLRRDSSPVLRGHSPDRHSDRDRHSEWIPAEKQSPVSQRGRRRSVSSVSTPSTDRSRSPTSRARAVHRLPSTSTPAKDVMMSRGPQTFGQEAVAHGNNKHHKKKKNRKNTLAQTPSVEAMPPPSSLPSNSVARQRQRTPPPPPPTFVPASATSWHEQDEISRVERQSPPYTMMGPPPSPPPPRAETYYSSTTVSHSDRINSREPPVFVPGPSGFLEPTIPPLTPPTSSSTTYPRFVPASTGASAYTANTISEYGTGSRPGPGPHPFPTHDQHTREHYQYQEEVSWRSELHIPPPRAEPSRVAPLKHAGFKPIDSTNTSVKRFFPDEEDMDIADSPTYTDAAGDTHLQSTSSHISAAVEQNQVPEDVNGSAVPQETTEDDKGDTDSHQEQVSEIAVANTPAETPRPRSRTDLYVIVSQVGEGTFGKVYKARNTVTNMHVALKRIRMESEKDGFPVTAMREIKLLQSLRHENVIRLYEMMVSSGSVYMVFEYMDHDLTGILSQTQFSFTDAHLKSLCLQMLAGLAYLHHKGVIHRDIKGSNILVNNRGELKLADFGLARFYQKRRRSDYTNRVITLWYRPPELLFGATIYGPEVDMWSAGCIMLELFTKKPVFQGNDEISQLDVIYRIIGTPTLERWSDAANMPWYELVKPKDQVPNHFRELFKKWMSPAALDLAERLLDYDPSRRATAIQAMEAPYFTEEEPPAERPVGLATLEGEWHELETKRERAKKRKKE